MSSYTRLLFIPCWLLLTALAGCQRESPDLPFPDQRRVINYWAIWCTPCRTEIPELNALHQATPLQVLGVNFEGHTDAVLASQAADLGIDFPLLEQDPGPSLGQARPTVLPTTWLVNPEGIVTDTLVGPQTQESILAIWETRRAQRQHNGGV